ncbi:Acetolactate synthase small subunit, mitochondrial [Sphaceloma murrayae]|uniref:Acetolactate synthase small subunit, mitochondrial n=1 Tax=Sphaceloma murrayae TaxID=2082308 RepID=A0A2K1QY45_9PEZI|nr:Acetolactate synthase small subunit, mitochondrial [Sphaceloma murrayae]
MGCIHSRPTPLTGEEAHAAAIPIPPNSSSLSRINAPTAAGAAHSRSASHVSAASASRPIDRSGSTSSRPNKPVRPPSPVLRCPPERALAPWTAAQLAREREAFFDTRVTGDPAVWNALRIICEMLRAGDVSGAQGVMDAVGLTCPTGRIKSEKPGRGTGRDGERRRGGVFDEQGRGYEIPGWVVSDPEDLDNTTEVMAAGEKEVGSGDESEEEEKGKGREGQVVQVRARLSDKGVDVVVEVGVEQKVRVVVRKVQEQSAKALYRALLRSAASSPLPSQDATSLRELVQYRFRRNRYNASTTKLKGLFDDGYRVLDQLDLSRASRSRAHDGAVPLERYDSAIGQDGGGQAPENTSDPGARGVIDAEADATAWLASYVREERNARLLQKIRFERSDEGRRRNEAEAERRRREAPRFDRPGEAVWRRPLRVDQLRHRTRPGGDVEGSSGGVVALPGETGGRVPTEDAGDTEQESGKLTDVFTRPRRKVPVLFSAQRIPVLRFTKPQPKSLSLFLISRIEQRQRRIDRAAGIANMIAIARGEDLWDSILEEDHGVPPDDHESEQTTSLWRSGEQTWAYPHEEALEQVKDYLELEAKKIAARVRMYVDIVDREKELKEQERKERVMERNRRAFERKTERWKAEGVYVESKDPKTSHS